jgi:hypothetical protein
MVSSGELVTDGADDDRLCVSGRFGDAEEIHQKSSSTVGDNSSDSGSNALS